MKLSFIILIFFITVSGSAIAAPIGFIEPEVEIFKRASSPGDNLPVPSSPKSDGSRRASDLSSMEFGENPNPPRKPSAQPAPQPPPQPPQQPTPSQPSQQPTPKEESKGRGGFRRFLAGKPVAKTAGPSDTTSVQSSEAGSSSLSTKSSRFKKWLSRSKKQSE